MSSRVPSVAGKTKEIQCLTLAFDLEELKDLKTLRTLPIAVPEGT